MTCIVCKLYGSQVYKTADSFNLLTMQVDAKWNMGFFRIFFLQIPSDRKQRECPDSHENVTYKVCKLTGSQDVK